MEFSEYKKNVIDVTPESEGLIYHLALLWLHLNTLPLAVIMLGNCVDKVIKIPNMSKEERIVQLWAGPTKIVGEPVPIVQFASSVFSHNDSITDIILQSNLWDIQPGSFNGCIRLERITIPKSIKKIGACTFKDCIKLTDIYYEGTREEWEEIEIDTTDDALNKDIIDEFPAVLSADPDDSTPTSIAGNLAIKKAEIHYNCIL